ncbi:MAG: SGNH/GDSL hydrolase family protein [Clostridia bacterium]|nr:SGNH/GDSL hydrolase family protein [Clostridia bacterium]
MNKKLVHAASFFLLAATLVSCSAGNDTAGWGADSAKTVSVGTARNSTDLMPEDGTTADITENMTPYEKEIYNAHLRSVLFEGSDEMKSAIADVVNRARKGEKVSLVTFGDSITFGAGADTGKGWSDIVYYWFESLDGDPDNGNVKFTNAGIGSTELVYGVSRVSRDVLSAEPDLVIVDFGTNDVGLPHAVEAYEGILSKLISRGIPVIDSCVCPRSGANIQEKQRPVNVTYGVPQLSFKSAFFEHAEDSEFEELRADSMWSADNVHPTNNGHRLYAEMVIDYLEKYIIVPEIRGKKLSGILPAKVTENTYADAEMTDAVGSSEYVSVVSGKWTDDYNAKLLQITSRGWQTSETGSRITFVVSASNFHIMVTCSKKTAYANIYVDGKRTQQYLYGYSESKWMTVVDIYHGLDAGEHVVEIEMFDSEKTESDWFGICAVGFSSLN